MLAVAALLSWSVAIIVCGLPIKDGALVTAINRPEVITEADIVAVKPSTVTDCRAVFVGALAKFAPVRYTHVPTAAEEGVTVSIVGVRVVYWGTLKPALVAEI